MEKNTTATNQLNNKIKTMEVDRAHTEKGKQQHCKQALEWNPQGKRKRGRPKNSWRRGIISELQAINTTWGEAKRKDQDRTRWKETVVALCPQWDEME